jgi:A/G-specific adenine glycosylase
LLDGNVVRVLTRQLGVFVDGKEKRGLDLLWMVADELVKCVAWGKGAGRSEVPGLWNQALMELGSTVCTPRPKCWECPVRDTCRAYEEGVTLIKKKQRETGKVGVEQGVNSCTFCAELDIEDMFVGKDEDEEEEEKKVTKKRKRETTQVNNTISKYFKPNTRSSATSKASGEDFQENDEGQVSNAAPNKQTTKPTTEQKMISKYCSLFPKKIIKNKVPEEESVVCLIELKAREGPSKWLVEQRPATGKCLQPACLHISRAANEEQFMRMLDTGC